MKNHVHVIFSLLLFIFFCLLYYQLVTRFPLAYIWATYEDLLGEWTQFYLFLFALIFSLRYAFIKTRYRFFFILLSIACFYVVMEEISWGQRLFGWNSSPFFRENNLQGETNLHNMLTGPYSTLLKKSLAYGLALGLSGFGLLYPLALKYKWQLATWLDKLGIPAPPLYLAPFFVSAAYLEISSLAFNEAEIAEVFVGVALSLTALHYLHVSQFQIDPQKERPWTFNHSKTLSYRIAHLIFISFILSIATTFSIYASEDGKQRADNRIKNGVEKFSGRYQSYENWEMVLFLNQRLLKESPLNPWILRNIGEAYRKMDNLKLSDKYLAKAIRKDLAKLKKEPWRASTNRSLVLSYRIKGDTENSKKYLSNALRIGLNGLKNNPENASALYSLGKTYLLMDEKEKAKPLLAKAYQLKPTSKTYRKEYYRSIR